MTNWQPLSVRRGLREPAEPQEGVPPELLYPLRHWLEGRFGYRRTRSQGGLQQDVMMQVAIMAGVALKPTVHSDELMNQIMNACFQDQDTYLDVIDATLKVASGDVASLRKTLELGGSAWTVAEGGSSLQRRVDPVAERAFAAATRPAERASEELRTAWEHVYGREPNASDAWDHGIKAVEEVLVPIVVPNKTKATLGDVLGQLKGNPAGWTFVLHTSGPVGSVETLEAMLRLMWPNPDRHGGAGRVPSLAEAEAVVQLAVLVVQWARGRAVTKK